MNSRRPGGGCMVNETIAAPKPPGDWVDEERCICRATYAEHRAYPDWMEAVNMVRQANGGWENGGGFRSRGPVLWVMHVLKLQSWYTEHYFCGAIACEEKGPGPCVNCEPICPWCKHK